MPVLQERRETPGQRDPLEEQEPRAITRQALWDLEDLEAFNRSQVVCQVRQAQPVKLDRRV
jgi:hypothetical protein